MYYHAAKQDALAAGVPYQEHFAVDAQLEPNNGWVLVLTPKSIDVFRYALEPILQVAEIDLSSYTRLRRRPDTYKRPPTQLQVKERKRAAPVTSTWDASKPLPW